MESRVHQVIGVGLALMFAIFGILRLGDPDSLTWLVVYGFLMALVLGSILRPLPVVFSVLPMVMALLAAVLIWPDLSQEVAGSMNPKMEAKLMRDSLVLLFCAASCGYVAIRSHLRTKKKKLAYSSSI